MTKQPQAYIVCTPEAIYGTGATVREAVLDAADWLDPGCDPDTDPNVSVWPASISLVKEVESRGGAIAWGRLGHVRCTLAEEAAGKLDEWQSA